MPYKRPRVAEREEVSITHTPDGAVVAFLDESVGPIHLQLGQLGARLTDDEILAKYNETVRKMEEAAASYVHVPVEIPPGRPQIEFIPEADQWVPRGAVLRCCIMDGGPDGEAQIEIDDRILSLREFGRLLTTYAGWGMRIVFVPDDELDQTHAIEVREPDQEGR